MPTVIDYATVTTATNRLGLQCVYHNSGSFGFVENNTVKIVGWLGPADATVRPGLGTLIHAPPPYPQTLAAKITQVWQIILSGPAWVLPKSHWAHDLDPAYGHWLDDTLSAIGINPAPLRPLANAAAIEFSSNESAAFIRLVEALLLNLKSTDYAVIFPEHPHLVTLHHHQQVWWQTADESLVKILIT